MSISSYFDYSSFVANSYGGDPDRDWGPWMREKFLDIKYPLVDVLEGAAFGAFERPLRVAGSFFKRINPQGFLEKHLKQEYSLVQLTNGNIERNLIYPQPLPNSKQTPSQEKLKHLLDRIRTLAQKMGIKKEIQVYAGGKCDTTAAVGGTFSISSPFILFDTSDINGLSDEALDHKIAHELVHINYNHTLKNFFFEGVVLVIDAIALISIVGILLIPFIEGTARLVSRTISRIHEKEADIEAIRILGTNRGAVSWLENQVVLNRKYKNTAKLCLSHSSNAQVQEIMRSHSINWNTVQTWFNKITPSGNNRNGLDHPPLTTRLDYCKALTLSKSA